MTNLSSGHKLSDNTLDRLLDLDGAIMDLGGGFRVKIDARKVPPTEEKPFGVDYSLSLFDPDDARVVGFDNAHAVFTGKPPSRKREARYDHRHASGKTKPYAYESAERLMEDFWNAVDAYLKKEGIS